MWSGQDNRLSYIDFAEQSCLLPMYAKGAFEKMVDKNQKQETEFAAFVGIDWADEKHAWAMQIPGNPKVERGDLDHTPEAVEVWAAELALRFAGRPIAVALEQSRGSLLFMLTKYAHLVLFPVHPTTLYDYRKGFRPSGAKSDPSDAGLLVDLLMRHREKLRRLNPDTEQTRTLQFLVEARRKFVSDKTRYSNRLTAYLKMYFPQVLGWFSEVTSPIAGDFLERWPSLQKLQNARPETLRKFFVQRHSCKPDSIDRRLKEIRSALPATHDAAVTCSCSAAVLALVRIMRTVRDAIVSYDQQIETLTREHPDFAIIDSLPGVGPALAPRLIAALGTQRDRYHNASELQSYSGIAPVLASSGKQCWVHWRWACPKFLRQTFHEWAAHSIGSSAWAKAYYKQQRAKGKPRNTVVRALAFKWIRILFRCWKDRKPYSEEVYRQALARHQQPAGKRAPVQLQWKNCAGFSKITSITS
jgi:transposase